jgi:RND family efflux transporter MFP subunit
MAKRIIIIVVIAIIVVVSVLQLRNNKTKTEDRVYQFNKETPIAVQTITLRSENANISNSFSGIFEADRETKLSAEVQGKINQVLVDVGDKVSRGQALVQLDNSLLQLQLEAVDVQIEGLEKDVKRYTVLTDAEAIQGVQLEKTELALKAAKVQKATIQEQINKTTIRAPFDGIVTAKLAEAGGFAAPGLPLLQITDLSQMKFNISVPEKNLAIFKEDMVCNIKADAYSDTLFSGTLSTINSKANFGNTFSVQFEVKNNGKSKLMAGMSGILNISESDGVQSIIIPSSAIVGTHLNPKVYVVVDGKAKLQEIQVSQRFSNKVVVSAGVKDGDVIVTNGFINVYDGVNVIFK